MNHRFNRLIAAVLVTLAVMIGTEIAALSGATYGHEDRITK